MLAMIDVVAGLGWEPEIRGLLTVVLAMAVLAGSVWLLLVTNTGTRLGSLIALTGFFGWMFLMGIFWWIYGIGWVGSSPTWQVEDVFIDAPGAEATGLQDAFVGNVGDLPDSNCAADQPASFPPTSGVVSVSVSDELVALCTPRAIELVMAHEGVDREIVIQELLNPQLDESKIGAIVGDSLSEEIQALVAAISADPDWAADNVNDEGEITDLGAFQRQYSREINSILAAVNLDANADGERDGVTGDLDSRWLLALLDNDERDAIFDQLVAARQGEIGQAVIDANDRLALVEDPRTKNAADLQASIDENIANANIRINGLTLSALDAVGPIIITEAVDDGLADFQGWNLQSPAQAGEATATADAFLRQELFPDGNFVNLDAYQQGGKPKREGRGIWDRVSHEITSTARITHPTNYTVVTVQQSIEKAVDPSKPPPIAELDPAEPTYSVVMIRDLGNLRLIPALFTFANLTIFLLLCLVLHWRDLGLRDKGLEV